MSSSSTMMKVAPTSMAIIGAGRMGSAIALSLTRQGDYHLRFVVSRSEASAESLCRLAGQGTAGTIRELRGRVDLVWLTVPDRELANTAAELSRFGPFAGNPLFVHTSGCFSIEALRQLREAGERVGGLHPLQAIASREQLLRPGTLYALEAESDRPEILQKVVRDLHGRPFRIPASRKALYHAAATVASNYLVVLAEAATSMFATCGMEPHMAADALTTLVTGTWDNVKRLGPVEALTGPVQRGDLQVVREHLMAVGIQGERALMDLYSALGRRATELALRQGSIEPEQANSLLRLLGGGQ
jgi:predicted short-subunit dehydrogenase-like oxidoreductase (DUF2520 family)